MIEDLKVGETLFTVRYGFFRDKLQMKLVARTVNRFTAHNVWLDGERCSLPLAGLPYGWFRTVKEAVEHVLKGCEEEIRTGEIAQEKKRQALAILASNEEEPEEVVLQMI